MAAKKRTSHLPRQSRGKKKNELRDELAAIYEDDRGDMPDMKNFTRSSGRRVRTALVFVAVLVLAGAVSIGWWIKAGSGFHETQVELSVEGPERATIGETITWVVRYRNAQRIALQNVELSLRLPQDFVITEFETPPSSEKDLLWQIKELPQGEKGMIVVRGRALGEKGKEVSARAVLSYTPANFNSEFERVATATTLLDQSPFSLTLSAQDTASTGTEIPISIAIKNISAFSSPSATATLLSPAGFTVTATSPTSTVTTRPRFSIPELAPSSEFKMQARGVYPAAPTTESPFAADILIERNGRTYTAEHAEKLVSLIQTDLSLKLLVNGSADKAATFPGGTLIASVNYGNKSDVALKNITLTLTIDTPSVSEKSLVDWSMLLDPKKGTVSGEQRSASVRRGTITWTRSQMKELGSLPARKEGAIDLTIPLKTLEEFGAQKLPSSVLALSLSGSFEVDGKKQEVKGNAISAAIQSDTELSVSVDEQGSTETAVDGVKKTIRVYEITILVKNSLHEIEALSLAAPLAKGVEWSGDTKATAGDLSFDKEKQIATWTLNRMPTTIKQIPLKLHVKTATMAKEDPIATLTEKIILTAKDKVTGETMSIVHPGATVE